MERDPLIEVAGNEEQERFPLDEDTEYGGAILRWGAHMIDGILILVVIGLPLIGLLFLLGDDWLLREEVEEVEGVDVLLGLMDIFGVLAAFLYFALFHSSRWQATIGKRLLGLKVVDVDGRRISFLRAAWRGIMHMVGGYLCLIGYILIIFTKRKQGLHDFAAATLVVKVPRKTARADEHDAARLWEQRQEIESHQVPPT